MSVKLRLTRVGKTKQPHYRVIASDSRAARDGSFLEILGQYNPRTEPSVINLDNDKAVAWLMKGAQPTERVKKILEISGAWAQFTSPTAVAVLTHVVRSIVDDPDAVNVAETEGRNRLRLEVKVGPGDLGRVIGRRGRTAQSIRTLVRAAAAKDGREVDVDFVD